MPVRSPVHIDLIDHFTFHDFMLKILLNHEQMNPNKPALINSVDQRLYYTYGDIRRRSHALSRALYSLNVRHGDVVLGALPTCIDAPVVMLGVQLCGAALSPVNPNYNDEEHAKQIVDCQCDVIICLDANVTTIVKAVESIQNCKVTDVIVIAESVHRFTLPKSTGRISFHNFYECLCWQCCEIAPVTFDVKNDVALLPYSSGTTGRPKGVMLTHYNLVSVALIEHSNYERNMAPYLQPPLASRREYLVLFLPYFHIFGLSQLNFSLLKGITILTMAKFDGRQFLQAIEKYQIRFSFVVPPIAIFLAKSAIVDEYDISSLQMIASGSAPMTAELENDVRTRLPNLKYIGQGYGMTEQSLAVAMPNYSPEQSGNGNAGMLMPMVELRVIDPDSGLELGECEQGELQTRGVTMMKGYLNRPNETKDIFTRDGYLRTGDIGYYDRHLCIYICDRLKELIKVNGFQVAPAELEGILLSHYMIADCAVIGVADEKTGEKPKAFIVVKTGEKLTEHAVIDFVAQHVSHYKRLAYVTFVSEIPRSPSGKILRRKLRAENEYKSKL